MSGVWLLLLLFLSVVAVVTAKTIKWKLLNIAIVIGFMGAGLGIGAALEVRGARTWRLVLLQQFHSRSAWEQ